MSIEHNSTDWGYNNSTFFTIFNIVTGMKKKVSGSNNKRSGGHNRTFTVLIIISALLLLTGIGFLLVEPIKSMRRGQITDDAMNAMESVISQQMTAPETSESDEVPKDLEETFIVPGNGNEIPGEEYDFIGDGDEEDESVKKFVASREAKLPKNVTLTCIGVLRIEKINKKLPVWNSTSSVALRYGVGLYEGSVRPGKNGNAAILGHNMLNTTLFSKLKLCSVGDIVEYITLDGKVHKYRIDDIKIIYKDKLGKFCDKDASNEPQLTLITCANEDYGHGYRRAVICHPV